MKRGVWIASIVGWGMGTGGCGGVPDSMTGSSGDATGAIVLALASVPPDVWCLQVSVDGTRKVNRTFDLVPGAAATLAIDRLPIVAMPLVPGIGQERFRAFRDIPRTL